MTYRMLASGLIAGFAAGLFAALLHFALVQPLLLTAEGYESGQLTHFAAAPAATHDHDAMATEDAAAPDMAAVEAAPSDLRRNALTVLFTTLIYASYGLILVAGMALAERQGHRPGLKEGVLWGLAGFATLQLAPALGLAPELPGSAAADLEARQVWWWLTAVLTAGGFWLLAFAKGVPLRVLGLAALVAPHLVGAPEADAMLGAAPPELAAGFAARVLGVGAIAWAFLGVLLARLWTGDKT